MEKSTQLSKINYIDIAMLLLTVTSLLMPVNIFGIVMTVALIYLQGRLLYSAFGK